jgi:hypothetical protein
MTKFIYLSSFLVFGIYFKSSAQFEEKKKTSIEILGFLDSFYSYDFNKPIGNRQDFLFNHNRHNEVNVNLALIALKLNNSKYRMSLGLQGGTFAQDAYSHEPVMYRNVHEASVGIALNKKNNLWFDLGIFSSHLGFENSVSIDNMTLTRSLVAENSPYYLSGGKLTYYPDQKWELAIIASNGWQRIQRIEGNSMLSSGTQILFHPTKSTSLNWSTFITTEYPDMNRKYRYFNNFYGIFRINDSMSLITGFDVGFEQKLSKSTEYYSWLSPVTIFQLKLTEEFFVAYRMEYFNDKNNVVIPPHPLGSVEIIGTSFNFDYKPSDEIAVRLEARMFSGGNKQFVKENDFARKNTFISLSMAMKIYKKLYLN